MARERHETLHEFMKRRQSNTTYIPNTDYVDIQQKTLREPFDINTHKDVFIDYLEIVILSDGTIEYAVPSHLEKLFQIACDKYKTTKESLLKTFQEESRTNGICGDIDPFESLMRMTGAIPVWNMMHMGTCNEAQAASLDKLRQERLYTGPIRTMFGEQFGTNIESGDLYGNCRQTEGRETAEAVETSQGE
jgi:hypothetical protein